MESLWSGSGGAFLSVLLLVTIGLAGCTSSSPTFSDPTFAEDVQDGEPVGASSTFPVGTSEVHVVVSYENLDADDGITYRWLHDGEAIVEETTTARKLGDIEDTGSGDFTFFVNLQGGWPPGEYTFELVHEGDVASEGSFTVGADDDVFGPVYFGRQMQGGTMQGMASSFDVGVPGVLGAVRAPELDPADNVQVEVTLQGVPILQNEAEVSAFKPSNISVGPLTYRWSWPGGLPPGHYNLTFSDTTGHEATGSVVVGDGRGIGSILFGTGTDQKQITGVDDTFPSDQGTIHAGYDIVGFPADTEVREVWEHDNQTIASRNFTLGQASDRDPYQPLVIQTTPLSSQDFATGTHYFGVYLDGELEQAASFEIVS